MAESVDAADLKSAGGNTVGVQVPLPPWLKTPPAQWSGMEQPRKRLKRCQVGNGLVMVTSVSGALYLTHLQGPSRIGSKTTLADPKMNRQ